MWLRSSPKFCALRDATVHLFIHSRYTTKMIRNGFLETSVPQSISCSPANKSTGQCQELDDPPAHVGRCKGVKLMTGHSAVGCTVRYLRAMRCKFTFGLFRGLVFFFLIGFRFCYSGIKQVTSILKTGSVLKFSLSQVWNCCLMKFMIRFSLPWSLPVCSQRPACIGSCRGGFWGCS